MAASPLDPRSLSRLLLYGSPQTRRALAAHLREPDAHHDRSLLLSTACSNEPWRLRARCLEVLGLAAGDGDEATARAILDGLLSERGAVR